MAVDIISLIMAMFEKRQLVSIISAMANFPGTTTNSCGFYLSYISVMSIAERNMECSES